MSAAAALTRELFDRGRWSHSAAALGALALPVILLSALAREGGLDAEDKSALIMHFVLLQYNIVCFGASLLAVEWKLSSLYPLPATTTTLVAWRMFPAAALMFVETVAWTAILNAMFHLGWPLWGPALFAAAAYAAIVSAVWITLGSRWIVVAITMVAAVLGFWLKSRYGGLHSDPTHLWDQTTPTEVFTLLAFTAVAYWLAVVGVARQRRGERPFTLGLVALAERLLNRVPNAALPPFRSPQDAQHWYDWRYGWLTPLYILAVLFIGMIAWIFTEHDPVDLLLGVLGIAAFLPAGALISGLVFGNVSSRGDLVIGQFLATRPATTSQLAASIIRAAALSLLIGWVIWASALAAAAAAVGVAALSERPLASYILSEFHPRPIAAALVGSWIILGTMISASLTGRAKGIVQVLLSAMGVFIAVSLGSKWMLSSAAQEQLNQVVAVLMGVGCIVITTAAFSAAVRRGFIELTTAWGSLIAWIMLTIGASLLIGRDITLPAYAFTFGVLALAVIPFAAAPLALAWNRHR